MKQRDRKKALYRQGWNAKLAEVIGLVRRIAAKLPEHIEFDEYHSSNAQ